MSVIPFHPAELKSLEVAAVELCGPHVGGTVWPALYVSNNRSYMLRYSGRDLSAAEVQGHRREYAQAQDRSQYRPGSSAELLGRLHMLFYNCEDLDAEDEQARRVLVGSVAFELLPADGGERTVNVGRFANIQRPDIGRYRITTRNPAEGHRARVYLIGGQPHPLEGFTTTDPCEAFQKMWELSDVCALHCEVEYAADMLELDRLIHEEGMTFAAASVALTAFRTARAQAQAR